MTDHSELAAFSLVRSQSMRTGTLIACAYFFLWAINAVIDPAHPRHGVTFFEPNLFPWFPRTVLFLLNIAFYLYIAWVCVAFIRGMQCVEERLIVASFAISLGLGLLSGLPNSLVNVFANYINLAVWTVAIAAAARMLVRYRNVGDDEAIIRLANEWSFVMSVFLYVCETFLGTAGVMAIIVSGLRLLYPTTHMVLPALTRESFSALSYLPYSPLQIGVGFGLGYLTALSFRSRSVLFVWVIPMAVVILYLCTYQPATVFANRWTVVLTRLTNTDRCSPPECYDGVFISGMYSAIAFSLGSWLRLRLNARTVDVGIP